MVSGNTSQCYLGTSCIPYYSVFKYKACCSSRMDAWLWLIQTSLYDLQSMAQTLDRVGQLTIINLNATLIVLLMGTLAM